VADNLGVDNGIIAVLRFLSAEEVFVACPCGVLDEGFFENDEDSVLEGDLRCGETDESVIGSGVFEMGDDMVEEMVVHFGLGFGGLVEVFEGIFESGVDDGFDEVFADGGGRH
jgi:hypothetical protein